MNESSYLNPADIKNQCDAAIRNLEQNNQATQLTGWNLDLFIGDSQLESEAFAALKQQMEDYKTVLQTIRMANQCDIEDFQFLKMVVGNQELDGNVILEQKDIAMSAKKSDEEKVERYKKKANSTNSATLRLNYSMKVAHYRVMAEIDQRLYDAWQEKQNMYDGIEGLTAGLFERSAAMRATVENALHSIRGAFQNGVYVPDMNASWRSEVYDIYFNSVFTISDNGEFKIDMEEVEKILSKDARDITKAEYDVLALAYLMADDEDLAVFIQCMMKDRKDYDYTWFEQRGCVAENHIREDYSEWKIDKEKMKELEKRVVGYAEGTLQLIQKYRTEGDDDGVVACTLQRNSMLQRMTLLNVIKQIGGFRGAYQAEYPTFTIKEGKNKELVIQFLEEREAEQDMGILPGTYKYYIPFGKSKVTISRTINGEFIDDEEIDYSEYVFTNHFVNYSFGNEMADFAADEVKGEIMGSVCEGLSEKVVEKTGNSVLGKFIERIPIAGDIAEFMIDTNLEKEKAEQDVKFIKRQYESSHAADIYDEFDCCVNFVDFDLQENKSHVFYPCVGETTDYKIGKINECFGEDLSTELTREILLMNPLSVWEFKSDIPADSELEQVYRDIIGGKR